jgi:hypothetical protein
VNKAVFIDFPPWVQEFDDWHKKATAPLCKQERRLGAGWAAKLTNVYLKTAAYIGNMGSPRVRELVHPPVDRVLLARIKKDYRDDREILAEFGDVSGIGEIRDYSTYMRVINGCRLVADRRRCHLVEVEELWERG